jgi:hypothetical protein
METRKPARATFSRWRAPDLMNFIRATSIEFRLVLCQVDDRNRCVEQMALLVDVHSPEAGVFVPFVHFLAVCTRNRF